MLNCPSGGTENWREGDGGENSGEVGAEGKMKTVEAERTERRQRRRGTRRCSEEVMEW